MFSAIINIWIGVQFYLFVNFLENGGQGWEVSRPPGVEGWLPIGALVSLLHFLYSGVINNIHPAGMIIFVVILLSALFFKKGFCSWVCPVGFISEILGDIADRLFGRRIKPPAWLDYFLRSLKYVILAFFLWAVVYQMDAASIEQFLYTDYNKVTDILMLRFFTDITMFSLSVISLLFIFSLIVRGFWCRYLCPYGALLGLISFLSPTRIVRNEKNCIDCSSCATVCPSFIKVDKVKQVVSDECTGCMACVDVCPVNDTLKLTIVGKKNRVSSLKWAAVLVLFFWGSLFAAKLWGPWENSISNEEYIRQMPTVTGGQFVHP